MERYWQGKAKVSGEDPVIFSLCLPKFSHGMAWDWTPNLCDERQAINTQSHGTAYRLLSCRMWRRVVWYKCTLQTPEGGGLQEVSSHKALNSHGNWLHYWLSVPSESQRKWHLYLVGLGSPVIACDSQHLVCSFL